MDSFAPHLPRLRRYARALVGDPHGADDLVQDTLERAWSKYALWQRGTRLDAWLLTIMHHVFVNQYRRRPPAAASLETMGVEPAVRAVQGDNLELRDLRSALTRLPAEQREVLLLVTVEECSYSETAGILGIPVGTVMSRLSRARDRLREILAETGDTSRLRIVK